jgi:hypothetical protein
MVRHWWNVRKEDNKWVKKILINASGLFLTTFILLSVIILKFNEGGWITLFVTGSMVFMAILIKKHYLDVAKLLHRLNSLIQATVLSAKIDIKEPPKFNAAGRVAVILVGGFNGLGLHTLFNVTRFFGKEFKNFIFVQVGVIDAGNFKGAAEVSNLEEQVNSDLKRYVAFMHGQGFYAEGLPFMGVDIVQEAEKIIPVIAQKYPNAVVFGGQLVFPTENLWTRWLHNDTAFTLQRKFYQEGIPFVVLPIRV